MVTLTAFVVRVEKQDLAPRVDSVWRITFPLVFIVIPGKTLFLYVKSVNFHATTDGLLRG
jgi:hypothetical protein